MKFDSSEFRAGVLCSVSRIQGFYKGHCHDDYDGCRKGATEEVTARFLGVPLGSVCYKESPRRVITDDLAILRLRAL